jgi:hypothetical protein
MLPSRTKLIRSVALLVLAGVLGALGCSGGGRSGDFAQVSGIVTKDSVPVDGAKVTFYSTVQAEGSKKGVVSVMTDNSGRYLIATVGDDPGLAPGMYKVTVTKLDAQGAGQDGIDQGQLEAAGTSKNLMPMDYENVKTTKLSVTLEAGKNEKSFDLKGKAGSVGVIPIP